MNDDHLVSVNNEENPVPIYMWYDNGTIYYYTESEHVYMNTISKYMFSNLQALSDIDELANFNTSKVTDMAFLFQNCIEIQDLSPISDWDVSCVQRLKQTFFSSDAITTSLGGMKIQSLQPLANWNVRKCY